MAELTDTYVVHGACSTCSKGMRASQVVLQKTHGVFLRGQAQMTVKDCKGEDNVICFGGCYSMENPSTAAEAEKIQKAVEEACPDTFLDKVMGFFTGGKKEKKQEAPAEEGVPQVVGVCTPHIIAQEWDHGQDGVETGGKRPMMGGAKLYCIYGGEIEIVESGQPEAGSGKTSANQDDSDNNDMASQLLTAAAGLGLGIAKLGKAGIALALENMEACVRGRIHQLLHWDEKIKGNIQMGFSVIPSDSMNSKAKLFQNEDLKEMDQIIAQYENKIYVKYKEEFDNYKVIRDKYERGEEISQKDMDRIHELFANTNIISDLEELGEELSSMEAVTGHKNDLVNFFNMVYTDNPIDLKSRGFRYPGTTISSGFSIWAAPWPKEGGGYFEPDYAGNWLYGYVGDEYFTTPVDDAVLKYGAGAAQLLSDLIKDKDKKEAAAKYLQSVLTGNYGDNTNEGTQSDAEMIQEGIDARRKKKNR
ncbi:DUF4280 domain-containing protein [Clostridium sp. Marseille-P2415]|uniref:DUF4280 domain-containing protein n=1 Tax=Clostridium sp. Marseille-P2415 TaxID=1805471 RepID=UPI0009883787|nr:PAAR-like protein [Clostridium sp. Marseille-P2415]